MAIYEYVLIYLRRLNPTQHIETEKLDPTPTQPKYPANRSRGSTQRMFSPMSASRSTDGDGARMFAVIIGCSLWVVVTARPVSARSNATARTPTAGARARR